MIMIDESLMLMVDFPVVGEIHQQYEKFDNFRCTNKKCDLKLNNSLDSVPAFMDLNCVLVKKLKHKKHNVASI